MKIQALIDCVGISYSLKSEETADLPKELAEKLIRFGYAIEVKATKSKEPKEKKVVNKG